MQISFDSLSLLPDTPIQITGFAVFNCKCTDSRWVVKETKPPLVSWTIPKNVKLLHSCRDAREYDARPCKCCVYVSNRDAAKLQELRLGFYHVGPSGRRDFVMFKRFDRWPQPERGAMAFLVVMACRVCFLPHRRSDGMLQIYALYGPRHGRLRYIGRSALPTFDSPSVAYYQNRDLGNWIGNLLLQGQQPRLKVLETIPEADWQTRKAFWVTELHEQMIRDLINTPVGGC